MKKSQLLTYTKDSTMYFSLKVINKKGFDTYSYFLNYLPLHIFSYFEDKQRIPDFYFMKKERLKEISSPTNLEDPFNIPSESDIVNAVAIENYKVYYEFKEKYPNIKELKENCPELCSYF